MECVYPEEAENTCDDAVPCGAVHIEEDGDLDAFRNCGSMDELNIYRMSQLDEVVFPCVSVINGDVTVSPQLELSSLEMPELETIEGFLSMRALRLDDVDFGRLKEVRGGVSLYALHETTELDWLSSLTTVEDSVLIYENERLEDLSGLSCLQEISGDLVIRCNVPMTDQHAEAFAASLDVGGIVTIEFNGPETCGADDDDTSP